MDETIWHKTDINLPDDALPTIAELPGDLRRVAEIIRPVMADEQTAVRAVFSLAAEFRGTYIYCRGLDEWRRTWRDGRIRTEYDAGAKVPELARRWGISERWVWDILGRLPVDDKQLRMWD